MSVSNSTNFCLAAIATSIALYILYRSVRRLKPVWVKVGTVSELYIHPVKGCRGLAVDSALCTTWGLQRDETKDKHFVIINEDNGKYISASDDPKLLFVNAIVEKNHLVLNGPEMDEIKVDLNQVLKNQFIKTMKYTSTEREVEGYDCGEPVKMWFQKYMAISTPLRLLYFVPGLKIQLPKDRPWTGRVEKRRNTTPYSKLTSFTLMSASSVRDLNARLEHPVQTRNFRQNIIVEGTKAYDEDHWTHVKINEATFRYVFPNTRCMITAIDPDTGEKIPNSQPLNALKKYRLTTNEHDRKVFGSSPVLGCHLDLIQEGEISIGDEVYVQYRA